MHSFWAIDVNPVSFWLCKSDNDYILSVFCVQIHEVKLIAGILHTIVFHRALGLVRPKDIDLELFEITYVSDSTFFHVIATVSLG